MFDDRLRALFDAHHDAVLRVLHLRRVAPSFIEDVAFDTWMDIARKPINDVPEFALEGGEAARSRRARAWVLTFARYRAMRWHRDQGNDPVVLPATEVEDPVDPVENPEEAALRAARLTALQRALETLDEETRALVEDVLLLDVSKADAARARGWSESMAHRRIADACDDLRRALRKSGVQR